MNISGIMDLHNHTLMSDGAHAPEEIIENAIEKGIDIIGITDHFSTSKCESVAIFEIDCYLHNLSNLKKKYKSHIEVLAGLEVCMNKSFCDLDKLPYDKLNQLDYILLEYLDYVDFDREGNYQSNSVKLKDIGEYRENFTCNVGLAHTNLLKTAEFYMLFENYSEALSKVVDMLAENKIFWELNVNSDYGYYNYLIEHQGEEKVKLLFTLLKEKGIDITVGSDTHSLNAYDIERVKQANDMIKRFLI